jgi:hypothetical protein
LSSPFWLSKFTGILPSQNVPQEHSVPAFSAKTEKGLSLTEALCVIAEFFEVRKPSRNRTSPSGEVGQQDIDAE